MTKRLEPIWAFGPLIEYRWGSRHLVVDYERNQVWGWNRFADVHGNVHTVPRYKRVDVTPATLKRIKDLVSRGAQ